MCPHTLRSQCLARPNDGNTARHARNVARATRLREPALERVEFRVSCRLIQRQPALCLPAVSGPPPGGRASLSPRLKWGNARGGLFKWVGANRRTAPSVAAPLRALLANPSKKVRLDVEH